MKATKIKMRPGFAHTKESPEIAFIYIEDCEDARYYSVSELYDMIKKNPNSIYVDVSPFPKLMPVKSKMHGNFVRSAKNRFEEDKLFELPIDLD